LFRKACHQTSHRRNESTLNWRELEEEVREVVW
jgi:hypothetical protein